MKLVSDYTTLNRTWICNSPRKRRNTSNLVLAILKQTTYFELSIQVLVYPIRI